MRIITWNIRKDNKKAQDAILFALSQNPDILCLQEVPQNILEYLRETPGYTVHASYDFISKNPEKHGYTVTLTRLPVSDEREIPYDRNMNQSIMNRYLYEKLIHQVEQHNAILITIQTDKGLLHVVNTRLSCAVNTRSRLIEFQNMIERVPSDIPTIFCGDYNVVDSQLVNRVTGWVRGFKRPDYKLNERKEFEKLFNKHNLINIFRGRSTSLVNRPLLQFDHILIPKTVVVTHKELFKRRYGSDHKMLLVDIVV